MAESRGTQLRDPDHDLVCTAQTGDESAFSELVHRYTGQIFTLALRTLGDHSDAEDAVQEIFLKVYKNLKRFDCKRRFFPWLYTIALNHLRSTHRRPVFRGRNALLPVSEELLAAPPSMNPEAQVIASETRELVARALEELKPIYRAVFLLRQLEGLSTEETATVLNIPANTVKTNLRRARATVAEILTAAETPDSRARISEWSESDDM